MVKRFKPEDIIMKLHEIEIYQGAVWADRVVMNPPAFNYNQRFIQRIFSALSQLRIHATWHEL